VREVALVVQPLSLAFDEVSLTGELVGKVTEEMLQANIKLCYIIHEQAPFDEVGWLTILY
jgi:hypothetical protein